MRKKFQIFPIAKSLGACLIVNKYCTKNHKFIIHPNSRKEFPEHSFSVVKCGKPRITRKSDPYNY